jgi:hypothetical protein
VKDISKNQEKNLHSFPSIFIKYIELFESESQELARSQEIRNFADSLSKYEGVFRAI